MLPNSESKRYRLHLWEVWINLTESTHKLVQASYKLSWISTITLRYGLTVSTQNYLWRNLVDIGSRLSRTKKPDVQSRKTEQCN